MNKGKNKFIKTIDEENPKISPQCFTHNNSFCYDCAKNCDLAGNRKNSRVRREMKKQKEDKMKEQINKAIAAAEAISLDLGDGWEFVYEQTEKIYMQKNNISDATKLTINDRRKIAATSVVAFKEVESEKQSDR